SVDFALNVSQQPAYAGASSLVGSGLLGTLRDQGFQYSFATINQALAGQIGKTPFRRPLAPYGWLKGTAESLVAFQRLSPPAASRQRRQIQEIRRVGAELVEDLTR